VQVCFDDFIPLSIEKNCIQQKKIQQREKKSKFLKLAKSLIFCVFPKSANFSLKHNQRKIQVFANFKTW
jgi:hypothetical protein